MGGKWRCLSPPWSLKHRDATLEVHPARLLLRRAGFLGAVGLGRLFEDVRRTHGPGSVSARTDAGRPVPAFQQLLWRAARPGRREAAPPASAARVSLGRRPGARRVRQGGRAAAARRWGRKSGFGS